VTIVPNIQSIKIGNDNISLCDTAGFHDEARSYVGVFVVSYMLEKLFRTIEELKIILVVSHSKFTLEKITEVL
jgi:hypothetical protein